MLLGQHPPSARHRRSRERPRRLAVLLSAALLVAGVPSGLVLAARELTMASQGHDAGPAENRPGPGQPGQHTRPPSRQDERQRDRFGIAKLHPTVPGGMEWFARWDQPRRFGGQDPLDPWFDADHGEASYRVEDGSLYISGPVPRMYVRDPALERQWRDVEITMYVKRVADAAVAYAGMVSVARTNHGLTGDEEVDLCDSRGLGARIRYDGAVDLEKETAHPANDAVGRVERWRDGMPYEDWIGYKHVVHDMTGGRVRQELWIDESGGQSGGDWVMVTSVVDDGTVFGDEPCAPGVDPAMPLDNDPDRAGSESGLPNLAVYFRSDLVGRDGLVYRWGSVREIWVP